MHRTFAFILAFIMGALPLHAELSASERGALRAEIRSYLLENPEVIVEVMGVLQNREEQNAAQRDLQMLRENADVIYNDPKSWAGGNLQGDITIVEFVDYRCSYCRRAHEEIAQLVAEDGNIRLVLKEFPILGEQSVLATHFALAVRQVYGDDAYKTAHDALMTFRGEINKDSLAQLAQKLGHENEKLTAIMGAPESEAIIAQNQQLAQMLQISGTPTFIVKETMVRGYVPPEGMIQIVAGQRGAGQ